VSTRLPITVPRPPAAAREVTLVDLLDRLLQGGIVIQGEITLSAAEIDLVALDLRILVAAIDKAVGR
jgi:hypothetical protein